MLQHSYLWCNSLIFFTGTMHTCEFFILFFFNFEIMNLNIFFNIICNFNKICVGIYISYIRKLLLYYPQPPLLTLDGSQFLIVVDLRNSSNLRSFFFKFDTLKIVLPSKAVSLCLSYLQFKVAVAAALFASPMSLCTPVIFPRWTRPYSYTKRRTACLRFRHVVQGCCNF